MIGKEHRLRAEVGAGIGQRLKDQQVEPGVHHLHHKLAGGVAGVLAGLLVGDDEVAGEVPVAADSPVTAEA